MLSLFFACAGPESDTGAASSPVILLQGSSWRALDVTDGETEAVSVVATHPDHLPITVTIGGSAATASGDTYTVELEDAQLVAWAEDWSDRTQDHGLTLQACAEDSAGSSACLELVLILGGSPSLDELALSLELDEPYLPADGSASARLLVTAHASAAGESVALGASGGASLGSDELVLTLGAGATDAEAEAWVRGGDGGDGSVSAQPTSDPSIGASVHVPVAGPPVFTPDALTLAAPATWTLVVDGHGSALTCWATRDQGSGGVAVSDGEGSLLDGLVALQGAEITVTADDTVAADVALALHCTDVYGQAGSAAVTVAAAEGVAVDTGTTDTGTDGSGAD